MSDLFYFLPAGRDCPVFSTASTDASSPSCHSLRPSPATCSPNSFYLPASNPTSPTWSSSWSLQFDPQWNCFLDWDLLHMLQTSNSLSIAGRLQNRCFPSSTTRPPRQWASSGHSTSSLGAPHHPKHPYVRPCPLLLFLHVDQAKIPKVSRTSPGFPPRFRRPRTRLRCPPHQVPGHRRLCPYQCTHYRCPPPA